MAIHDRRGTCCSNNNDTSKLPAYIHTKKKFFFHSSNTINMSDIRDSTSRSPPSSRFGTIVEEYVLWIVSKEKAEGRHILVDDFDSMNSFCLQRSSTPTYEDFKRLLNSDGTTLLMYCNLLREKCGLSRHERPFSRTKR